MTFYRKPFDIESVIDMMKGVLSNPKPSDRARDIGCLINYTLEEHPSSLNTLLELFPDLKMSNLYDGKEYHTHLAMRVIEDLDTPASTVVAICSVSYEDVFLRSNPVIIIRAHMAEKAMTQEKIDALYLSSLRSKHPILEQAKYMTGLGLLPSKLAFSKMILHLSPQEIAIFLNSGVDVSYCKHWKALAPDVAKDVDRLLINMRIDNRMLRNRANSF